MKVTPKQYAIALAQLCEGKSARAIDEVTKEFVAYFSRRGKAKLLPAIFRELEKYINEKSGNIPVTVVSSHPLDEETVVSLKKAIQKKSGKEPIITRTEDKKLVCGVRISMDHVVVDACIRTRIQRLKEHISSSL